jgi:hypothetical protein
MPPAGFKSAFPANERSQEYKMHLSEVTLSTKFWYDGDPEFWIGHYTSGTNGIYLPFITEDWQTRTNTKLVLAALHQQQNPSSSDLKNYQLSSNKFSKLILIYLWINCYPFYENYLITRRCTSY